MKIVVTSNNSVGKVNFSKVAKVGTITLAEIADVKIPATIQNGAVLTYNAANTVYILQNTLDGGVF
jgi:hypothetical protein